MEDDTTDACFLFLFHYRSAPVPDITAASVVVLHLVTGLEPALRGVALVLPLHELPGLQCAALPGEDGVLPVSHWADCGRAAYRNCVPLQPVCIRPRDLLLA